DRVDKAEGFLLVAVVGGRLGRDREDQLAAVARLLRVGRERKRERRDGDEREQAAEAAELRHRHPPPEMFRAGPRKLSSAVQTCQAFRSSIKGYARWQAAQWPGLISRS